MKEYYLPHIVHSHYVFFVLFTLEQMLELEACSQFLSFNQYILYASAWTSKTRSLSNPVWKALFHF